MAKTEVDKDGIFIFPETQGQKKVIARLKSLFSNEQFLLELEAIRKLPNPKKRYKKMFKFCYDYGLNYEMGTPLVDFLSNGRLPENLEKDIGNDVCKVSDQDDLYLNSNFPMDFHIPPSRHPTRKLEIQNFPIHIEISPWASKRDVLDFINKRWGYIRYMLDCHDSMLTPEKKRKKQERDDLIWQNQNKTGKEIAELVNNAFPEENLTYADIHSILYYLRNLKS